MSVIVRRFGGQGRRMMAVRRHNPIPAAGALPLYPFSRQSKRGETMPYSVQPRKVAMAPHHRFFTRSCRAHRSCTARRCRR